MERVSLLGGEVQKRGVFARAPRSRVCRTLLIAGLLVALLTLISGASVTVALIDAVLLTAVWFLTWPRLGGLEDPRLEVWLRRRRAKSRRRKGHAHYVAPADLLPGYQGRAWKVPPAVGRVEPLDLTGTNYESLFVLQHTNPAGHFLTVLAATDGLGSGLRSDEQYAASQESFGRLLAVFASHSRYLSGFQQINRVVPHDALQHEDWMLEQLVWPPDGASQEVVDGYNLLVRSYSQILTDDAATAEQHRNYLIARFNITPRLLAQAARYGKGPAGLAEVVVEELRLLRDRISNAGLGHLQVLGEQRTVAAMRAMQSADFAPDRHGGSRWEDAFLSFTTTPGYIAVQGKWLTRTGYLPTGALAHARFGPRWLAGVLTDISPPIVRTVSTRIDLVPAATARAAAVKDLTSDAAATMKESTRGKIDDGTSQVMQSASATRLADLAPGSNNAGVRWTLFITVQALTEDALAEASARIADALTECGINRWVWADNDQDLAWPTALPLARGLTP